MDVTSQIGVFFLGFFSGEGIIAIVAWFIGNKKLQKNKDSDEELSLLKNNIESIQTALQNFNLTQSRIENTLIRGGSQQQGVWGEFVLKNILDSVGLREGKEYETQKAFRDSDGNLQKPDVVVHMPGKRDVIIDSKVSLTAWHEYANATEKDFKKRFLRRYIDSIKIFIKGLGASNYSKLYNINTIDSVLMFMPIEPALLVLYNEGQDIVEEAWQKKIIIIGPSTLPYCLKAVENMWRVDQQTKRTKEIAALASAIYDKTVNVYLSFNEASKSLNKASDKIEEAKGRLQDGPGSLTMKVQKMKEVGRLATKKQFPNDVSKND